VLHIFGVPGCFLRALLFATNATAAGEVNMTLTVPISPVAGSPLETLPPDQPKVVIFISEKMSFDIIHKLLLSFSYTVIAFNTYIRALGA